MAIRLFLAALLCSTSVHALDASRLPKLQTAKPPPRAPARKPSVLRNLKPLSRADLEVAFGHAAKLYKVKTLLKPATTSFDLSPDSPQVAGKGRILQLVEASAVNYAPTTVDFRPRFNGSFHSSAAVTFEIDVIAGRVYLFDCHLAHGNYSLFFIGGNAPTGLTITGPDTDAHFVAPTFAAQSGKMVLFLNNADENVSWIWGGCTVTPSN